MNITERQNEPRQIERLAAQRQQYAVVKKILGTQIFLGTLVAVGLAFLGLAFPEFKRYIALWTVTVLLVDLSWLTPMQKQLRNRAAQIQENFDCDVLALPWHELKAGKKPDPEAVHELAEKYKKWAHKMPPLPNWYPVCVQSLPPHWGVIICQRTNCWWDMHLRRRIALSIAVTLTALAIAAVWLAFYLGLSLEDCLVKLVVPLSPTFTVGFRYFTEQRDAADRLEKLKAHAEKLWNAAIGGASETTIMSDARALQDEIFEGRKRNPPNFDIIFRWLRDDQEARMNRGAEELIKEAEEKGRLVKLD
jgi:hypothetical protein